MKYHGIVVVDGSIFIGEIFNLGFSLFKEENKFLIVSKLEHNDICNDDEYILGFACKKTVWKPGWLEFYLEHLFDFPLEK